LSDAVRTDPDATPPAPELSPRARLWWEVVTIGAIAFVPPLAWSVASWLRGSGADES
jgi:hypothetical protein